MRVELLLRAVAAGVLACGLGCAKNGPLGEAASGDGAVRPPVAEKAPQQQPKANQSAKKDPLDVLPKTLAEQYKGFNAEYWGERLLDADENVSFTAGMALYEIGDEGLRFSVKGFKSNREHVRFHSVSMLPLGPKSPAEYRAAICPLLVDLLKDSEVRVRSSAFQRLCLCGYKSAIPQLKDCLAKEPASEWRAAMEKSLMGLESKEQ